MTAATKVSISSGLTPRFRRTFFTLALVAIASAVGLKRIYYDAFAKWNEVLVLWLVVIGNSGTRKTPCFEDMC